MMQIRSFVDLFTTVRPFRWSWLGSTISMLGSRMIGVTYPLLAYTLTSSPTWIGWVMFASTAPALLWYIPAGALVDRFGRRFVMIVSEVLRGVLVAVLCLGMAMEWLGIPYLVVIALLEGALSVNSSIAETALIPTTVKRDNVDTALAMHETSVHGMLLVGRPFGGLLFGIAHIFPFIANAAMFFAAAGALSRVERDKGTQRTDRSTRADMGTGFAELWRNIFLRYATLVTAFTNLMVQGLIVVFLSEATDEGLPSGIAGLILAASGIGGVVGAFISPQWERISQTQKINDREPRSRLAGLRGFVLAHGRSVMLVHLWACAAALMVPLLLAQASVSFAIALLVIGLVGGLSNVTIRTMLSRVPDDRMARVVGISRLGSYSAVAIGPLMASLLLGLLGSGLTMLVLWCLMAAFAAIVTMVPVLRNSLAATVEPQAQSVV
jgi:MFS family permease